MAPYSKEVESSMTSRYEMRNEMQPCYRCMVEDARRVMLHLSHRILLSSKYRLDNTTQPSGQKNEMASSDRHPSCYQIPKCLPGKHHPLSTTKGPGRGGFA